MKILLTVFISAVILLSACTKTSLHSTAAHNPASSSEIDLDNQVKTRTALLTAHIWMYQGYYFHYIDQAHKGDPQYVRGNSSNLVQLDETRITYKKNGTFLEIDGKYQYPGTWKFTDNADTLFTMVYENSLVTDKNTIVKLTGKMLNYTRPIGSYSHNNFAYSELVSAQ